MAVRVNHDSTKTVGRGFRFRQNFAASLTPLIQYRVDGRNRKSHPRRRCRKSFGRGIEFKDGLAHPRAEVFGAGPMPLALKIQTKSRVHCRRTLNICHAENNQ